MMRLTAFLTVMVLLAAPVSAQQADQAADPGVVTPDIPVLYTADVAIDRVTKAPGERAVERAAEAQRMAENGNDNATQRAVDELERDVAEADSTDAEKLQQAQTVLQDVQQKTPTDANTGINNAIRNINEAKQREPQQPSGDDSPIPDRDDIPDDIPRP